MLSTAPLEPAKQGTDTASSPPGPTCALPAGAHPHLQARARFNRVGWTRIRAAACSGFVVREGGIDELGDTPLRPRRSVEPDRAPVPQARINEMIRAPKVRLVDEDGSQIGIKDTNEALEYAYGQEPRSRRGRRAGRSARREGHGLRQVPVRAGAEGEARAQAPGPDQHQGDQAQAQDRNPRLQHQEGPRRALPQPAREGQGDDHVPGPRAEPSGARARPADAAGGGREGDRADRVTAAPGRPQHGDGAGPHEERRSHEKRCQSRRHTAERRSGSR